MPALQPPPTPPSPPPLLRLSLFGYNPRLRGRGRHSWQTLLAECKVLP